MAKRAYFSGRNLVHFTSMRKGIPVSPGVSVGKAYCVDDAFLAGDANFMAGNFDDAISIYRRAKEVSTEIGYPLAAFNADVSELVTMWFMEDAPSEELSRAIGEIIGSAERWLESTDSGPMRDVRRTIYEDPTIESDLCVFFDGERNFECRVERKSLNKDCFGNLFWMGSLCPYFKEFLVRFYR